MTDKQKERPIDYGKSNGIMDCEDAILALQNAQMHKLFSNDSMFKRFVDKIRELKEYTPEKLQKRSKVSSKFLDEEDKKIVVYLNELIDDDYDILYKTIQSFDLRKEIFTKQQ